MQYPKGRALFIRKSIFFRWEPAPILVCVEDPTEDLDYVSKKCTSTTRVPYSLHFPLLSFTKQGGRTPKSKPRIFLSHPPPYILERFSGYGTPFLHRRAASAHMTKSLALDPHDPSSRGDLLPSRVGIPPRVASIIWNRNFPSLLSDPSTHRRV